MTIQELFIESNKALKKVIDQIKDNQWDLDMPPGTSSKPTKLKAAIQYHTYDDAWVGDVLSSKTKNEVGPKYDYLLSNEDVLKNYDKYNLQANNAVSNIKYLDKTVHLSYGDFKARDYLQHITSFRAFRTYDIAKLIGANTKMDEMLVKGLYEEYMPVAESYRQMHVFPPEIKVDDQADLQTKLLAMAGRK